MIPRAIFAAAFLFCAAGAQAQMYKCVDARGVTQYSDRPCPEGKGKAVDIHGQPPISGTLAPRGADTGAAETEFRRRQIERGRAEEAVAARAEEQKRRCAELHAQLNVLTRFNRISRVNEKGERVYMDDDTRNARIEQLNSEIARDCR